MKPAHVRSEETPSEVKNVIKCEVFFFFNETLRNTSSYNLENCMKRIEKHL